METCKTVRAVIPMSAPRPLRDDQPPADFAGKAVGAGMVTVVALGISNSFVFSVQFKCLLKSSETLFGRFCGDFSLRKPPGLPQSPNHTNASNQFSSQFHDRFRRLLGGHLRYIDFNCAQPLIERNAAEASPDHIRHSNSALHIPLQPRREMRRVADQGYALHRAVLQVQPRKNTVQDGLLMQDPAEDDI